MDQAAGLVFGDAGEGEPDHAGELADGQAREPGELALDGDRGPPPELADRGVPQDGARVVETVRAQRLAEQRVVGPVPVPTSEADAVRAVSPPGCAGLRLAGGFASRVDGAERRRGQRHEQPRVPVDGVRDALAAAEAGGDQMPAVDPVDLGAGPADGGPPAPAGLQQHLVGFAAGVEDARDGAGGFLDGQGLPGQPDRVGAVAGVADLVGPPQVAVGVGGPAQDVAEGAGREVGVRHGDCTGCATAVGTAALGCLRRASARAARSASWSSSR